MEYNTSFSHYRELAGLSQRELQRQLQPMLVGGLRFQPFEAMREDDRVTIRYRRDGSPDEIGVTIVRAGNNSGRIYGTGQIGQVFFGRDIPGFPLSDYGFNALEAALDQDFQRRHDRAGTLPNADHVGISLAASGVTIAPEEAPLPIRSGKQATAKTPA